jgi:rhodanese-related sulfurtransferase
MPSHRSKWNKPASRTAIWSWLCGAILSGTILGGPLQGVGQEVVIQSLAGNGVLTWSNSVAGGAARVEWAPSLGAAWKPSWDPLTDIPISNNVMAMPVPMFYRVVSYPLPVPLITNVTAAIGFSVMTNRFADTNFIVLDVRSPSEYTGGHVKTALNVNYYSAAFEQTLMKLDRKRTYMLYCGSGTRSALAREVMRRLNFMEVYNLTQGYSSIAAQPGASAYVEQ